MKKNIVKFAVVVAAMTMFVGCTPEMITTMNSITLSAEEYNGGDKAYISNGYACWENNDQVKLYLSPNSKDGVISVTYPNGSPHAEATASDFNPGIGDTVYAGYPKSLFSGGINFNNSVDITLPSVYTYEKADGKQRITAPMVGGIKILGYEDGQANPNVLKMKNLCTLLKIRVAPPSVGTLIVDTIVVVNTSTGRGLSGNATINMNLVGNDEDGYHGEPSFVSYPSHSAATRWVKLVFGANPEPITSNTGAKDFYIPIPPLPASQTLRVYVHNSVSGNWFYKIITTSQDIPGNSIATLPGPSISDSDAQYDLYNYIQNNGKCYIDLEVAPDNTSKMEMVFKLTQATGSQYYSGSNNPDAHVTTFSIGGSTTAGTYGLYLSSYFAGSTVTSEGSSAATSITRGTAHFYRVTTEVKGTPGNYYMETKFEELSDLNGSAPLKVLTKNSAVSPYGIDLSNPNFSGWAEIPNINVFGYNAERLNPGMKLYSYRVWKNGVLTHNFVPAKRTTDNAKGVLNVAVRPYEFIEGTGVSGYSYTLGN